MAEPRARPRARRRALGAALVTAAIAAIGVGGWQARRRAEARLSDLGACLLGDALAPGERASERFIAIELARPAGASAAGERWPQRCAVLAERAASASWALGSGVREPLRESASALFEGRAPSGLDELFAHGRSSFAATPAEVVRPWAPVILVPRARDGDLGRACPAVSLLATLDRWDDDVVLMSGKPGCKVAPHGGRPLAALWERTATDIAANTDHALGAHVAVVAGRELSVEDGSARWGDVQLGPARSFRTCSSGDLRAVLLERADGAVLSLAFVDPRGASEVAELPLVRPDFPGHDGSEISRGPLGMSCRGREARVAWAWSTAIGGRATHEIVVATCAPGTISTRRARVEIETVRSSGCGYCEPDPKGGVVLPPSVLDLERGVVVAWTTWKTGRARLASLERLSDARDIVLWHVPEGGHWDEPRLLARGSVALLGLDVRFDGRESQSRLFRVDASDGAITELALGARP